MVGSGRVHDRAILDALEGIDPEPFEGDVWRITRKGRDALRGSNARGRWTPEGNYEVLYTSLTREGALAEVGYRLSLEPIWPSLLEHQIHRITVRADKIVTVQGSSALESLGVDLTKYESFDYRATQAIAAAAHFLELKGLLVPSARGPSSNLVLFLDLGIELAVAETQAVDWGHWRKGGR